MRHLNGGDGLCEGTDLVELDEDRVRRFLPDAALQSLRVGDIKVVADQLHPVAELLGEKLPAFPIVLEQGVFDADDRVVRNPFGVELDELFRG